MSKPSNLEVMEKAREMGLKLSKDRKSWAPIDELVVQLPPPQQSPYLPGLGQEIVNRIIFWTLIFIVAAAVLGMIVAAIVENLLSGLQGIGLRF